MTKIKTEKIILRIPMFYEHESGVFTSTIVEDANGHSVINPTLQDKGITLDHLIEQSNSRNLEIE
jgi:hypothetical protein